MGGVRYYFCYNGVVYKKSAALPILEAAASGEDCGYSSYDDALFIVHECQDSLGKNTLRYDVRTVKEQRMILDQVEILPSNHIALYSFLHQ